MHKKIGTSSIASALLLASASCFAQIAPATISLSNQINSGAMTSGMTLQNIVVTTAVVGSTAIGNAIDTRTLEKAVVINGAQAVQTNSGSMNASMMISGPSTQFNNLTASALSAGNMQNYTSTAAAGTSGITSVTSASQNNSGAVGASLTWSQDPTGNAWLNSTALGNAQTFSFTK